ncbi:MAG: insulinase family protein [candidate division Zixibacteria bacterium]|nr:insulinase family protein [candidate division Zixibacteria bacterium]
MKNTIRIILALALSALLVFGCGSGTSVNIDTEGYGKTILDNGITVLVNHDESTSLSAGRVLIGGGVLSENAANNGISNLMIKMLMKGNSEMSANEITEKLEFLGASVTPACFRDYSAISFVSLTENFDETMDVISKCLLTPTFPEDELEKLKVVVDGALKSSDDNQSEASSKLFWNTAYGDEGYGLYPTGKLETITLITVADIRSHYDKLIGGDNIILSFATDLPATQILSSADKLFGALKNSALIVPAPSLAIQDEKEGFVSFDRNQSFIYMGAMFTHLQPDEVPLLIIVNQIMGGGVGSRLWDLRQKEKLAYAVYTQYGLDKYDAMFRAAIGTDTSKVQLALASLNREWDNLIENGITEDELTDAKINLKNNMMFSFDRKSNRANNMAYYQYLGYGQKFFLDVVKKADRITVADVNSFVKNKFTEDRKFLSIVGKK